MLTRGYQKNKERFSKEAGERYQNLSEEEKIKSANILVRDIEIFLKKKIKNDIKIF